MRLDLTLMQYLANVMLFQIIVIFLSACPCDSLEKYEPAYEKM